MDRRPDVAECHVDPQTPIAVLEPIQQQVEAGARTELDEPESPAGPRRDEAERRKELAAPIDLIRLGVARADELRHFVAIGGDERAEFVDRRRI
jgi:hypothetical protein